MRALTIHDQKAVEVRDLSAQFYLTEEDVGQNRAEACKEKLQELNNAVDVSASTAQLTPDYLEQFQVGPSSTTAGSCPCSATSCLCLLHQQLWIQMMTYDMLHVHACCRWWC